MDSERRGGRADRAGRYGNAPRGHNLQDQDYRLSGPEQDEPGFESLALGLQELRGDGETSQKILGHNVIGNDTQSQGTKQSFPGEAHEHCASVEESRDQDYRTDTDNNLRPSHIIMLRMLPPNATTVEIRARILEQGIQPKEVRLMRNKTSGQSRGFAFVEFNLIQEATRWMEINQGVLLVLGQRASMHYSDPKPRANEDWLCNKCGVQNFKRREKCFKCCTPKAEAELKLPLSQQELVVGLHNRGLLPLPAHYQTAGPYATQGQTAPQQQTDTANDTLILRNLGAHTSVDAILLALSPFATLSPSNVRLIKDKHTNLNRGFAFLQLSTIVEASQLLQILQTQLPPLSIDGKAVVVEFAKGSKRDLCQMDTNKVSSATVASTAIAAAQWAVTQSAQTASDGSVSGVVFQQAAAVTYDQETISGSDGTTGFRALPNKTQRDYTVNPVGAISQPLNHAQGTSASLAAATSTSQCDIVGARVSGLPAIPGTEQELKQYPVPNMSTYQYDESSGYYYDPLTGLYYEPNSQYYYNPHSLQYMYWDGEKHCYVPAEGQSSINGADSESKDKKEKNKSKTAQQIAKDMERWAKSLNRQKENMRSSSGTPARGRSDDFKESASADAGYAVLEKKGALLEHPQLNLDQMRQTTMGSPDQQLGLVPAYNGDADSDEERGFIDEREGLMTDWSKLACLLCRRQFPSKDALIRHQQLSELHKQNLEQMQYMPSKEKLSDGFHPPDLKKRKLLSM